MVKSIPGLQGSPERCGFSWVFLKGGVRGRCSPSGNLGTLWVFLGMVLDLPDLEMFQTSCPGPRRLVSSTPSRILGNYDGPQKMFLLIFVPGVPELNGPSRSLARLSRAVLTCPDEARTVPVCPDRTGPGPALVELNVPTDLLIRARIRTRFS